MKEENAHTDEIQCPNCRKEFIDSFEYFFDDRQSFVKCDNCEALFKAEKHIETTYTSWMI